MKVAVIGGGESGVGAALLAKKNKYEIFVSDGGKIQQRHKDVLSINEIEFEESNHDFDRLSNVDLVIKSPGVSNITPVMKMILDKGIKVISEIEFGFMHYEGQVLSITGSNGKTTASGLLYHILKTAGKDVEIAGNYGYSFARMVAESSPEIIVLEISSFQLDDIDSFRPAIAILLNISPDHLDRYDYKMENYVAAKFRISENQTIDDFLIYNGDDPWIKDGISDRKLEAQKMAVLDENLENILSRSNGDRYQLSLIGRHNMFNASCVVEATRVLGLSDDQINEGLKTFVNMPHRLEVVGNLNSVQFVNDSKATNVDAVYSALEAVKGPIIWILGGTDKGNDYAALFDLVKEKVKIIICLGIDNHKIKESFKEMIPTILESEDMVETVALAFENSVSGDTVLLSPACASFDLFNNYIDRGDQFRAAVMALKINKIEK